jgi:phage tail sheath protein FI
MTSTYSYPGVYVEEKSSPSISVSNSPTAVPVFIGAVHRTDGSRFTEFNCVRVNSWLDYCSRANPDARLSVEVKSTPGKDGGAYTHTHMIVMSIFSLAIKKYFENGGGPCYLCPQYDSSKGSNLPPAIRKYPDITLLVALCATAKERDDTYDNLNTLLASGTNYFLIADCDDGSTTPDTAAAFTAAYYPALKTKERLRRPADGSITVTGYKDAKSSLVGTLADLKTVDEPLYKACSEAIDTRLAAEKELSAAAVMAGVYCAVDRSRGCWKAPANVALSGVSGVAALVDDISRGQMNDKGINVIRELPNRGIRPWGSRTLAGASTNTDTSWRYVPVRRLFNSAETDIRKSMRAMVFEPNSAPTWEKVRGAIQSYLHSLWRKGALAGSSPQEAYFVQIGKGLTMSDEDIKQGKMIAKVGMAAARPAEFVILQFTQDVAV